MLLVAGPQLPAQNAPQEKTTLDAARLKPYFTDSDDPHRPHAIEFRAVDQMTEQDRLQASNAESAIAEQARYSGLEFNQGQWSYRQVVCPALPNPIFLRFLRDGGAGDVSVFTASIPRGEEGRVRIIPIQRRGYSLFSPAPINTLTLSAFNHIRAEENPEQVPAKAPDWLGTALCYAALAGGHPRAASVSDDPASESLRVANTALLRVENNGGAVLSFTDVSAHPRPMRWTMTFDRNGKLGKGDDAPAESAPKIEAEQPLAVNHVEPRQARTQPKVKTYNPPLPAVVTE